MLIFIHPCSFLYVNDVIKSFQLSYPYHICGESIANCKIWPEGVRIFLIKNCNDLQNKSRRLESEIVALDRCSEDGIFG